MDVGPRIARRSTSLLDLAARTGSSPQVATVTGPAKALGAPAQLKPGSDPVYLIDLTALGLTMPEIIKALGIGRSQRDNVKRARATAVPDASPRNLASAVMAASTSEGFATRISAIKADLATAAVARITEAITRLIVTPLSPLQAAAVGEYVRNFEDYAARIRGNSEMDVIMDWLGLTHPLAVVTVATLSGAISPKMIADPANAHPKLVFAVAGVPRKTEPKPDKKPAADRGPDAPRHRVRRRGSAGQVIADQPHAG